MIKCSSIKELVKKYNENKFSHIFLIETNNKKELLNDVLELVKVIECDSTFKENCMECNLCHLIDTNTCPSLSLIYPDGQAIKKSQMEELKILFASKPYLTKYNIYIINDAEKFNASSANTMLKFIEEPEQNILGFLITNNKENVINTIKSRCEIVKAFYEVENNVIDKELYDLAISYISETEIFKSKSIVINKKLIDKKLEKDQLMQFFQILLNFYLDLLNGKLENELLTKLKTYTYQQILKRINLINDIIDKLNYNVNINLLLDYYILSLED